MMKRERQVMENDIRKRKAEIYLRGLEERMEENRRKKDDSLDIFMANQKGPEVRIV